MKEKERRQIILIKEIQTYSGLENFGDTYSLIHLGGCIYPVEEYIPSEKYENNLGVQITKVIIRDLDIEIYVSEVETLNDLLQDITDGCKKSAFSFDTIEVFKNGLVKVL